MPDADNRRATEEVFPTDDDLRQMRLGIPGSYSTGKIAALATELTAIREIHRPVPVEMIDWEASSAANDEVLVNVMVCRECFSLAYPAGDSDGEDYAPEVIWPCATMKPLAVA